MTTQDFFYRLFFTRDDDLDAMQILYICIVVVSLAVVWRVMAPSTPPEVMTQGLVTLRWMMGLLVVTAVPKWMAPIFVNRKDSTTDTNGEVH